MCYIETNRVTFTLDQYSMSINQWQSLLELGQPFLGRSREQKPEMVKFGVLIEPIRAIAGPYLIEPVGQFDEIVARIRIDLHEEGYLYQPVHVTRDIDPFTRKPLDVQPNTRRPAPLYRKHGTHQIRRIDDRPLPDDFLEREGALLIHLLALLYKGRCQFESWWFDGRIPVGKGTVASWRPYELSRILSWVLKEFNSWPTKTQAHYSALLHLFTRSETYFWPWEQFLFYYMCVDGIWKIIQGLLGKYFSQQWCGKDIGKGLHHRNRLVRLRNELLGHHTWKEAESEAIARIIKSRNEWFHEAIWNKGGSTEPKLAGSNDSGVSYQLVDDLNGLVTRLLLGVAELPCEYLSTPWWGFHGPYLLGWDGPR
jgi:hypothetical protein